MENSYDSNFPRLPSTSGKSTVSYRSISENQNVVQNMQTADIETVELNKITFEAILYLETLYILLLLFTEVIHQAITAKQNDKLIDLYNFMAESTGKKWEFPSRLIN